MSLLQSIILGIIQGLTEFLPVSSSGHLEIAKAMLGADSVPAESMLMTVVLHFATACSTIVIFRKDILEIIKGIFQFKWNEEFQFALKIVLSMIPAAIIGIMYDDLIESFFGGQLLLIGLMLIVTAALLYFADFPDNNKRSVGFKDSLIIGIAQAVAILPGISRSGSTISSAILLKIDRKKAARFSFLMVIPLIFGKMAKDVMSDDFVISSDQSLSLGVGFIAAFITGLLACTLMIKLVQKSKLIYFAIYCLLIGIGVIIYSLLK